MPAEVQEVHEAERGDEAFTPIVLIHDGGGTIFQYFMLGYLGRQTYAIANPHFESGSYPAGGMPELARDYAEAIQQEIPRGSVILGGWSFGGVISVEIARLIAAAAESELTVTGILMIDSYCPWADGAWKTVPFTPSFRPTTSERMKDLTKKSYQHARDMVNSWEKPSAFQAPPVAMIKAEEQRSLDKDDGRLGWSTLDSLTFLSIDVVPGDHFSMFGDGLIDACTANIKAACQAF